jgi:hypothetical protein
MGRDADAARSIGAQAVTGQMHMDGRLAHAAGNVAGADGAAKVRQILVTGGVGALYRIFDEADGAVGQQGGDAVGREVVFALDIENQRRSKGIGGGADGFLDSGGMGREAHGQGHDTGEFAIAQDATFVQQLAEIRTNRGDDGGFRRGGFAQQIHQRGETAAIIMVEIGIAAIEQGANAAMFYMSD